MGAFGQAPPKADLLSDCRTLQILMNAGHFCVRPVCRAVDLCLNGHANPIYKIQLV
jgi:hypothetical protein